MLGTPRVSVRLVLGALVAGLAVVLPAVPAYADGMVSGTVVLDGTSTPLEDIAVTAWQETGVPEHPFDIVDETYTGPTGTYSLPLPPGTYKISFQSFDSHYRFEAYNNASTLQAGADVVVGSQNVLANAGLIENGGVSGTVTADTGGLPLLGVEVTLEQDSGFGWEFVSNAFTDENGAYTVHAAPGTYRICFSDYAGLYVPECNLNKGYGDTPDTVTVTGTAFTGPIDAGLADAGRITGLVTGADTLLPLPFIEVRLYENIGTELDPLWDWIRSSYTDGEGNYVVGGGPGTYKLEFVDNDQRRYASEFYNDKADVDSANGVAIVGTGTTAGKDAVLAINGSISGTVTNQLTTAPLEGAEVTLYQLFDDGLGGQYWDMWNTVITDENGQYRIYAPNGSYRLEYSTPGFTTEYWDNAATVESAQSIAVSRPTITPNKNAALAPDLGPAVTNNVAPSISGSAKVGSPLSANPGTWTPADALFAYQWQVGGVPVLGANGLTYTPVAADAGKVVTLVVTAAKVGYSPGAAVSAPTAPVALAPAVPSTTTVKAKKKGTTVKLVVTVKAAVAVTGQVKVFRKAKLLKTLTLVDGKAKVKLKKQPHGTWKYKASYLGSPTVLASSGKVKVAV